MSFIDDIGGPAVVDRLADRFYTRVLSDPLLRPLFRDPDEDHAGRMAWFLTELFGGEPLHSERRGGFSTMVAAHRGLKITEAQRQGWVAHMLAAAEEVGLPPAAMVEYAAYLGQGSRLAMSGSQ